MKINVKQSKCFGFDHGFILFDDRNVFAIGVEFPTTFASGKCGKNE